VDVFEVAAEGEFAPLDLRADLLKPL